MDNWKIIYDEVFKLSPIDRLAFALTILDEASEKLGLNFNDINSLRADIYNELGDVYSWED